MLYVGRKKIMHFYACPARTNLFVKEQAGLIQSKMYMYIMMGYVFIVILRSTAAETGSALNLLSNTRIHNLKYLKFILFLNRLIILMVNIK